MVIVACVAVIGLLALPSARDGGARLTAAARQLTADLEYAQAVSMGHGDDPCVVVFRAEEPGYYLARVSDPATPITHPLTGGAYAVRFGHGTARPLHGVSYQSLDAGDDDTLAYTAIGSLRDGVDASVTLRCGDATLRIVIDADTGEPATP